MHMRTTRRLRRAALVALTSVVMTSLATSGWDTVAAGSGGTGVAPGVTLPHVKAGLGCWESGGRYTERNSVSGAYGKYQIMPANWPSWARKYLGRSSAKQTAANQEKVASGKLADLHRWLAQWNRVVYWWLTGDTSTNQKTWSDTAQRYVSGVMSLARRSGTPAGRRTIPASCFSTPPRSPSDPPDTGGQTASGTAAKRQVVASILNVRTGPGLSFQVVDGLQRGSVVTVLDHTSDAQGHVWIKVSRGSQGTGWIARWWTSAVD